MKKLLELPNEIMIPVHSFIQCLRYKTGRGDRCGIHQQRRLYRVRRQARQASAGEIYAQNANNANDG